MDLGSREESERGPRTVLKKALWTGDLILERQQSIGR